MKVDPTDPRAPISGPREQPFKQLLAEAKKEGKPNQTGKPGAKPALQQPTKSVPSTCAPKKPQVAGVSASAVASVAATRLAQQTRQIARQQVNAEAERLSLVRAQHHQVARQQEAKGLESTASALQKVDARVLSLIVKELEASFEKEPPQASRAANTDGRQQPFNTEPTRSPAPGPADAPARAEQAVALIERIETFVRSARPALALTLNNSLGARVEIERLGPGKVALKLVGQRGPPSADAVARIRDELQARGLKVGALSVA
ncbi:MAG: hypothetical protein AB1938_17400 [Myxococcota bacterium]